MKATLDMLAPIPLFHGLPEAQLEQVRGTALKRAFEKGRIIVLEGDEGEGFYVLLEGLIDKNLLF